MDLDSYIIKLSKSSILYKWWEGEIWMKNDPPFYVCDELPDINYLSKNGCNCAGFINLLFCYLQIRIPGIDTDYPGGTYSYGMELKWEILDITKSYPKYSLILRPYNDINDQGHIGILLDDNSDLLKSKFAHCYPKKGITIDKLFEDSYNWTKDGYYKYVCVPANYCTKLKSDENSKD
jgi:hypothetical protein